MIKDVHTNNPKPLLKGDRIPCRHGSFARSFQTMDILERVWLEKVRETMIAREVGDSVLYHSLLGVAS